MGAFGKDPRAFPSLFCADSSCTFGGNKVRGRPFCWEQSHRLTGFEAGHCFGPAGLNRAFSTLAFRQVDVSLIGGRSIKTRFHLHTYPEPINQFAT